MMNLHFGIVEDRNDPMKLGRVRVRVHQIHTANKVLIPTEGLPWATVVLPTTSSGMSGVGLTPNIVEGTQVLLTFTDGDNMQQPLVIGTVPGYNTEHNGTINNQEVERDPEIGFNDPNEVFPKSNYVNHTDLPRAAVQSVDSDHIRTQFTSTNPLFSLAEPADLRQNHRYPYNQVRQVEGGHYEEWDSTPGNERINREHKSGTFEEIRPDGAKVQKIVKNKFTVIVDSDSVYVGGVCNLHIGGDANTYIGGNWNVRVAGDHNVTVDGNETINITGNKDVNVTGHATEDARTINLNSGSQGAARIGDTADTGDQGTGSHFDTNSAGTNVIESGSRTVFIGD